MSVWPAWEVREDGGATSWFNVRLAFTDGACVDALAVMSDGCVSLEDVRAQPALSLDDLAELAEWIEGPLFEACGIEVERDTGAERDAQAGQGAGRERNAGAEQDVGAEQDAGAEHDEEAEQNAGAAQNVGAEQDIGAERDGEAESDDEACHDEEAEPDDAAEQEAECAGPRRVRSSWPRGIEVRRLVAQAYRAAQEEGVDPVLAVMCATGHSRRKSLRLIGQARDAGFLAPRRARR